MTTSIQPLIDAVADDDNWAVEAVEILLRAAEEAGCSDLHVLCQRERVLARGRRDGALFHIAEIPVRRRELLIARFKVLAGLPAFIRNEPQDGRIEWRRGEGEKGEKGGKGEKGEKGAKAGGEGRESAPSAADDSANTGGAETRMLRVSFLPTIHGQNAVIRFPERAAHAFGLDMLGMSEAVHKGVADLLSRPEGTILLTGPSSSGKTTTMYAMLQRLHEWRGDRLNFLTIEDPIERDLGFAGQVQVNEAQGLTFERALRSALRQDPNVLMIGEIRDAETALTAIQAGMTGHLVLSTIHAGRASRVFTRILSMGIAPYLVASALSGAVAQRLARLLCAKCRRPAPEKVGGFAAPGCEACAGTGHQGRAGLFELICVSERLRELILSQTTPDRIAAEADRERIGDLDEEARKAFERGAISRAEYEFLSAGKDRA